MRARDLPSHVIVWSQRHSPFLVVLLVSIILQLLGEDARALFEYQRLQITHGDWWRVLSGHVVHLGWMHWLLNIGVFAVFWSFLKDSSANALIWCEILALMLGISLLLMLFSPQIEWYSGFSGVLHGLAAMAAYWLIRQGQLNISAMLIAGLTVKLLWEQFYSSGGSSTLTGRLIGAAVVTDAHLYGVICGLAIVVFSVIFTGKLSQH